MARQNWLDADTQTPLIDEYTHKLGTFVEAMADGVVDQHELQTQEENLAKALAAVEGQLSDALHADVTKLLCELTAYNVMQTFHALQAARTKTVFRG
ncbi:MAG TPA: hypothetical protein VL096_03010 [Pirellulaceae bacterium]|nr:hypothetical protein [Pirellulaceae bacterium]